MTTTYRSFVTIDSNFKVVATFAAIFHKLRYIVLIIFFLPNSIAGAT